MIASSLLANFLLSNAIGSDNRLAEIGAAGCWRRSGVGGESSSLISCWSTQLICSKSMPATTKSSPLRICLPPSLRAMYSPSYSTRSSFNRQSSRASQSAFIDCFLVRRNLLGFGRKKGIVRLLLLLIMLLGLFEVDSPSVADL
jgi:hypothetical protein